MSEEIVNSEDILKVLEKLKDKNNYQRDCNDGSYFIELFANEIYILCKFIEDLQQKVEQKDKEIERLNNIIEELEKYIKENSIYYNTSDGCQWIDQFKILDKLKELKENNK